MVNVDIAIVSVGLLLLAIVLFVALVVWIQKRWPR
jgi:hypothetical protein